MINDLEPLNNTHKTMYFCSGEKMLDAWLQEKALKNSANNASKTFVMTNERNEIIAYYCLSSGSMMRNEAASRISRNMPAQIPIVLLGRLAVHYDYQGRSFGRWLIRDAAFRCCQVAEIIGAKALVAHAISEPAKQFYFSVGFVQSPLRPMTMMISLQDLKKAFNL
ncbi:GNAT family N-acetyltransferase [Xenorhabdus hominickii]|uniref:GNAT family acetyltransferase n=1 Tax=Xenorhabdus hominickii TaxID=351679 RepID=A0A1V0M485_XENHO|nr:GNAT family N-acetyltransferase [Xenorhabdus hominickii]ARD69670.1 hypothetical protein [Xenorhabdus hominickii]PHM52384.1 GNAT family acetyltransferase [Xenorhabdus hominickii]